MKRIMIIGILLPLLYVSAYYYIQPQKPTSGQVRIAILTPTVHAALQEIEQAFCSYIHAHGQQSYKIDSFNAHGDKNLMRAQADEIFSNGYDAVFTIGAQCSQMAQASAYRAHVAIPIIFTAVDDPVGIGLVADINRPGGTMTGIQEVTAYEQQIDLLQQVKPATKKIVLVYDPSHGTGLESVKNKMQQCAQKHGMHLISVAVFAVHEITTKVPAYIEQADVLLVLKDNTVVSGIDTLIHLCNQAGVTLYASDLNSGDNGAALSFGVYEATFGSKAAEQLLRVIEKNQPIATCSVLPLDTFISR